MDFKEKNTASFVRPRIADYTAGADISTPENAKQALGLIDKALITMTIANVQANLLELSLKSAGNATTRPAEADKRLPFRSYAAAKSYAGNHHLGMIAHSYRK